MTSTTTTKRQSKLDCPISCALDVVGDQWSMLIIRDLMLFGGVRRFDELCDGLEISRNILTERLRKLADKEIVIKQPVAEGGRRMEYKLTAKGWGLVPVMLTMLNWTLEWENSDIQNYRFVDEETGEPVRVGEVLSADGRKLGRKDIRIVPLTDQARDYLENLN